MRLPRVLRPKAFLNPVTRVAIATFAWNHRHEVLRWGRSLYDQVVTRRDVSPTHVARVGGLLAAIATRDDLRNAPELRKVSLHDDRVDLDVDETWPLLPTLLERVGKVKGIREIRVNGATHAAATPVRPAIPA